MTWEDASRRLEHLAVHGSITTAFTFKTPFDPGGRQCRVDRSVVKDCCDLIDIVSHEVMLGTESPSGAHGTA